jgi:hypothetical protein
LHGGRRSVSVANDGPEKLKGIEMKRTIWLFGVAALALPLGVIYSKSWAQSTRGVHLRVSRRASARRTAGRAIIRHTTRDARTYQARRTNAATRDRILARRPHPGVLLGWRLAGTPAPPPARNAGKVVVSRPMGGGV